MYRNLLKPALDRLLALLLILLLLPVMLIVALLLWVDMKESPFFSQARGGYKGCVFNILKFKTMRSTRNEDGELLPDSMRISRVGGVIRKLSLDELPQLFNVLRGDMSFVGPRPFFSEYLEIYTGEDARRHEVKPGITGWAQVSGRNMISWKRKFELDRWYVDNLSFLLDVRIAYLTVMKVFKREGVNQSAESTMEKYNGKN